MIDALNILHAKDILHKNIRSENILISYNNYLIDIPFTMKISFVSLSSLLDDSKSKCL